ncbi:MAG: hypothetical protein AAB508_00275 [Patescibacteria group bacterium]
MMKLQITLTDQEAELLAMRGSTLGYDVTKYAKFLLAQDAASHLTFAPAFKGTVDMKHMVKDAISQYRAGKTKTLKL